MSTECVVCGYPAFRAEHAEWCDRVSLAMRALAAADTECGTMSGYRAHLRRGENTCPSCRGAVAAYQRARTASLRLARSRPMNSPLA